MASEAALRAATGTVAREQEMAVVGDVLEELRAARPGFVFAHSENRYWASEIGGDRKYNAGTKEEMLAKIEADSEAGPS
jgi:hypothetical protein